jgi:hypothetical protein
MVGPDPLAAAFLTRPEGALAPSHTLVIPVEHAIGIQDVSAQGLLAAIELTQRVARGMKILKHIIRFTLATLAATAALCQPTRRPTPVRRAANPSNVGATQQQRTLGVVVGELCGLRKGCRSLTASSQALQQIAADRERQRRSG